MYGANAVRVQSQTWKDGGWCPNCQYFVPLLNFLCWCEDDTIKILYYGKVYFSKKKCQYCVLLLTNVGWCEDNTIKARPCFGAPLKKCWYCFWLLSFVSLFEDYTIIIQCYSKVELCKLTFNNLLSPPCWELDEEVFTIVHALFFVIFYCIGVLAKQGQHNRFSCGTNIPSLKKAVWLDVLQLKEWILIYELFAN